MPATQPTRFYSAIVLAAITALTGCENHKSVDIHSTPPGAALTITKLMNGTPAGDIPVNKPDDKTQVTSQDLQFPASALPTYQVTARLYRYRDNSIMISWDTQKDYEIPLLEYKRPMDSVRFEPVPTGRVWNLMPKVSPEMAYLQKLIEPTTLVTNQTQLTASHDDTTVDYLSLAASPIEDVLVYQKVTKRGDGGYDSRLFKRNTKNGLETQLTSTHAQEYTPAFTYGGDAVVFSSDNASDNPTLWQIPMKSGGSYIKYLTRSDAADYAPSVGQSLMVYSSFPPKALEPQIWRCAMDGREAGYLTEGVSPQISPDERQILFLRKGKGGFNQLWLMDKDGDNVRQLTQNFDYDIADPRWSPDGKWIAYSGRAGKDEDKQANSDIWVIASDGSNRTFQLTSNGSCDTAPAWDRNGTTIYFRSNRGGAWNIWKFDVRANVLQ
jgi:dipeptidyl aminopeptidase/acylaminoacyl peptidase